MNINKKLCIFREILNKYNINDFIDASDFNRVSILFKNHPNWKIKKGCGILKIQVISSPWKKKAFLIHRKDNSTTDISIITVVNGYNEPLIKRINNACRTSIIPIIIKKRNRVKFGIDCCPITKELLIKNNIHIDHYNLTFNELFNLWIKSQNIKKLKLCLNNNKKDNVMHDKFIDKNIEDDFVCFHNNHTHLRAVSTKANLSILKENNDK